MFPPLTVGASLVLAESKGHLDPSYIVNLLVQHNVNEFIFSVPTLVRLYSLFSFTKPLPVCRCFKFAHQLLIFILQAREYVNELRRSGHTPYNLMKSWSVGGENVPAELFRDMQEVFPQACIMNVYGPTEVTAVTVHHPFPRGFEAVVIGKPDPNTHVYIVDSSLRPVPVGVPGELLLSGPRLALGYAGRPDLTEAAFVPNPCIDLVAGRVDPVLAPYYQKAYRTGDLVRWRNDGTIDFLGRIDRQVKITGVRIELGEVEGALESTPGVSQSVATALTDPSGQKRLVGYVTPSSAEPAAVIAHCRTLLLPAMVPSVVVPLDEFPLLPNGKVDVRSLPAPDWSGPAGAAGAASGRSCTLDENDVTVISIILDVIGLDKNTHVSLDTDIFDLGASSLHVSVIVGRMRRELGVNLDMREVYGNPTVKILCDALRQQNSGSGGKI